MAIDFERLDAAIDWAVEHPDKFDMDMWFQTTACGTTACLAGTVALQAGWTPFDWEKWGAGSAAAGVEKDGRRDLASQIAAELLGLDFSSSDFELFYVDDIAAVIKIRNAWAREAGVPERTWSPT